MILDKLREILQARRYRRATRSTPAERRLTLQWLLEQREKESDET